MVDVIMKPARKAVKAGSMDPQGNNLMLGFQHGLHPTRIPLSLAVVMDTSGSMHEDAGDGKTKLEKMKEAIIQLVKEPSWDEDDEIMLIEFDFEAKRIYGGKVSNLKGVQAALDGMESGGGTELAKGLDMALSALGDARHEQRRIVVFTDGEIHDAEAVLGRVLPELRRQGISLLAFAVGVEYQWDLLVRLADATRGAYHHLSSMNDFCRDLEAQLIQAKNEAIRDVTLRLDCVEGVEVRRIERVVPFYAVIEGDDEHSYGLGDLRGDQTTVFVIKLALPQREQPGEYRMLTAHLSWSFGGQQQEHEEPLFIEYCDNNRDIPVDSEVIDYVTQAQVCSDVHEAVRSGDVSITERKIDSAVHTARRIGNPELLRNLTQIQQEVQHTRRVSPETVRRVTSSTRNTTRLSQHTRRPRHTPQ